MKTLRLVAIVAALAASNDAFSAHVEFFLHQSFGGPGQDGVFDVYVKELDGMVDNGGIAAYGLFISSILTIDHNSPRDGFVQGPNGVGPAGFTLLRSHDNNPVLLATQDSIAPTPNIIYGFGQFAGSFASHGFTDFTAGTQIEQPAWHAALKIASGTFAQGAVPQIQLNNVDTFANVFESTSSTRTKPATVTVYSPNLAFPFPPWFTPEPAGARMGLTGILVVAIIGRWPPRKAKDLPSSA
jgi:hypothetical protein